MISNEAAAFLWDARRAAEHIIRFTAGRSYDDYLEDDMLRSAVERQFESSAKPSPACGGSILRLRPRFRICQRPSRSETCWSMAMPRSTIRSYGMPFGTTCRDFKLC